MKNLLITAIELKEDKNGNVYKRVGVQQLTPITYKGIQTMSKGQQSIRNWFAEREITLADGITKSIVKATSGYDDLEVGDIIDGEIKMFITTPYKIDDRLVEQYTTVVLAGENAIKLALNGLNQNDDSNVKVFDESKGMFIGKGVQVADASLAEVEEK